jgi:acyl-CoA thioesterase
MTTSYERAARLSKVEGGHRKGRIDDSWHQGRGAFGGLLAATTLAAMTDEVNDSERIPRSLTLHFCAPAAGELDLTTEIVRIGSRVTHATARVSNERGVTTFASASFGRDRPAAETYARAKMPDVEPAAELGELFAGSRFGTADVRSDEHYLVDIRSRWADDGYTEEVRDLWSPRGVLLAQCRQLIALL